MFSINKLGLENVIEQYSSDKYQQFKSLIMSKITYFVDDCKDIKINVHSALNDFLINYDLIGWVRRDTFISSNDISEENYKLIHENYKLNKQLKVLQQELNVKKKGHFNDYSFYELVSVLENKVFTMPSFFTKEKSSTKITALKFYVENYIQFKRGIEVETSIESFSRYLSTFVYPFFIEKGLLSTNQYKSYYKITSKGQSFYSLLEMKKIKKYIQQ